MPVVSPGHTDVSPNAVDTWNGADSQPWVIEYARMYGPDLAAYLTKFGQGASNYDANGHYARIAPTFNRFTFQPTPTGPGVLAPTDASANPLGSLLPAGLRRCPGSAAAPPPDGSAPFVDDPPVDCDLDALIPGP